MIKWKVRKHTLREIHFITCEDITHRESLEWIKTMLVRGYNIIDFRIETYTGEYPALYNERVRCVVEYN